MVTKSTVKAMLCRALGDELKRQGVPLTYRTSRSGGLWFVEPLGGRNVWTLFNYEYAPGVWRITLNSHTVGLGDIRLNVSDRIAALPQHLEVSFLPRELPEVLGWVVAHLEASVAGEPPAWLEEKWRPAALRCVGKPLRGYFWTAVAAQRYAATAAAKIAAAQKLARRTGIESAP